MTASLCVPAMSLPKDDSSSTAKGYEPQAKKQKIRADTLLADADRAEQYYIPNQPTRVPLNRISWHPDNRGGQEILPLHAQEIALDISTNLTSKRRYGSVKLVQVPENVVHVWLAANRKKAAINPLLANFEAMSPTGPYYATVKCTHTSSNAKNYAREGTEGS